MRRWVVLAVATGAVLVLSSCEGDVTRPGAVGLDVNIDAGGAATAQIHFDAVNRPDGRLRALGEAVAIRLFPSASSRSVGIDDNGDHPFVVIDAHGVYDPGPHPRISLDSRAAVSWLLANGIKTVDVFVDSPRVPLTASWTPADTEDPPWGWTGITAAAAA